MISSWNFLNIIWFCTQFCVIHPCSNDWSSHFLILNPESSTFLNRKDTVLVPSAYHIHINSIRIFSLQCFKWPLSK
jgi:hypothetical protein